MAENDDYLETIENNHLDGTNGSLNMTDNSLGVRISTSIFNYSNLTLCTMYLYTIYE